MFKTISKLMVSIFFLSSCTTLSCVLPVEKNASLSSILPRHSFVKIERIAKVKICSPLDAEDCVESKMGSSGSGFVIKNDDEGSYIMTAAHVCDTGDTNLALMFPGSKISKFSFTIIDLDGIKYSAETIKMDKKRDMCIAYVYSLAKPPVKLAYYPPRPGDVAYNTAAPVGVFDTNMVPILSGYYSGEKLGMAIYTIPVVGGSSGSPVLNQSGELIGMIHSAHIRFHHLSLSPTHRQITEFIRLNTKRRASDNLID